MADRGAGFGRLRQSKGARVTAPARTPDSELEQLYSAWRASFLSANRAAQRGDDASAERWQKHADGISQRYNALIRDEWARTHPLDAL